MRGYGGMGWYGGMVVSGVELGTGITFRDWRIFWIRSAHFLLLNEEIHSGAPTSHFETVGSRYATAQISRKSRLKF